MNRCVLEFFFLNLNLDNCLILCCRLQCSFRVWLEWSSAQLYDWLQKVVNTPLVHNFLSGNDWAGSSCGGTCRRCSCCRRVLSSKQLKFVVVSLVIRNDDWVFMRSFGCQLHWFLDNFILLRLWPDWRSKVVHLELAVQVFPRMIFAGHGYGLSNPGLNLQQLVLFTAHIFSEIIRLLQLPSSSPSLVVVDLVFAQKSHLEPTVEICPLITQVTTNNVHTMLVPSSWLRRTPIEILDQLSYKKKRNTFQERYIRLFEERFVVLRYCKNSTSGQDGLSLLPVGNQAHFPMCPLSDPPTQTPVVWSPVYERRKYFN